MLFVFEVSVLRLMILFLKQIERQLQTIEIKEMKHLRQQTKQTQQKTNKQPTQYQYLRFENHKIENCFTNKESEEQNQTYKQQ